METPQDTPPQQDDHGQWMRIGLIGILALIGTGLIASTMMQTTNEPMSEKTTTPKEKPRRYATVEVTILDDDEDDLFGQRGKAELFLKITSSKHPDISLMMPLNVGQAAGKRRVMIQTPFEHMDGLETLDFELLDDDQMSEEEQQMVLNVTSQGGYILHVGAEIWAITHGMRLTRRGRTISSDLAKNMGKLLISQYNQTRYKHYGFAKYRVNKRAPTALRDSNPLTITHNGKARAELGIYYTPKNKGNLK